MAAPANKTIGDLTGKWVLNKTLSDSIEPGLAIQGIGYLTRKAVSFATVTLHVKQYVDEADPALIHIDIDQTATGGIKGTSEHRRIDGQSREHSDWLFGKVSAYSVWAGNEATPLASLDVLQKHGLEFLGKSWLEGADEAKGPDGQSHLISVATADQEAWIAVQVWGFEIIGGERRYTRHVVIKNTEKSVDIRLVYDYIPQ